jgi:hypothetical protein
VRYMLNIYVDESRLESATPEEMAAVIAEYEAFGREARERGAYVAGEGLKPAATATLVRVRDGELLLTDGPFAERTEQLGGFYLLDCEDLDEAIEWAAKIPGAQGGTIEVRPVMDYEPPAEHQPAATTSATA